MQFTDASFKELWGSAFIILTLKIRKFTAKVVLFTYTLMGFAAGVFLGALMVLLWRQIPLYKYGAAISPEDAVAIKFATMVILIMGLAASNAADMIDIYLHRSAMVYRRAYPLLLEIFFRAAAVGGWLYLIVALSSLFIF